MGITMVKPTEQITEGASDYAREKAKEACELIGRAYGLALGVRETFRKLDSGEKLSLEEGRLVGQIVLSRGLKFRENIERFPEVILNGPLSKARDLYDRLRQ